MGACFFLNKQTKLRNDLWLVELRQYVRLLVNMYTGNGLATVTKQA